MPTAAQVVSLLERWIPRESEVALVDVPVHRNVGDLFILAATERLLESLGCRTVYRAGVRDYTREVARRQIGRKVILVGLGGGNFGNLYPRYQALRERVAADFPGNRIVILPQSLHFSTAEAQAHSAATLRAHPDLRLAVRDQASLDIATRFTSHVALLPDIVHALGGVPVTPGPSSDAAAPQARRGRVWLLRRDRETCGPLTSTELPLDWPDLFPAYRIQLALGATAMSVAPASVSAYAHACWSRLASELLARAITWMRGVDHLVTDRLHAAIVARLAGRPVTLHDNTSGKLSAYYDAWWQHDPEVTLKRRGAQVIRDEDRDQG